MNDTPIHEHESLIDRLRDRGIESYRLTALKVAGVGLGIMFVGELMERSGLSTIGIWVMLSAFPMHGAYLVAHYVQVMKDAKQDIDEAANNAAAEREARGDE